MFQNYTGQNFKRKAPSILKFLQYWNKDWFLFKRASHCKNLLSQGKASSVDVSQKLDIHTVIWYVRDIGDWLSEAVAKSCDMYQFLTVLKSH